MLSIRPQSASLTFILIFLAGCISTESEGEKRVKYTLKDAKSAEFRNERKISTNSASDVIYCGEVNSKNSFGAMTGFKKYVVKNDLIAFSNGEYSIYEGKRHGSAEIAAAVASSSWSVYQIEADRANMAREREALGKQISCMRIGGSASDCKVEVSGRSKITAFDTMWDENCK
jgi:hypothetical protein